MDLANAGCADTDLTEAVPVSLLQADIEEWLE